MEEPPKEPSPDEIETRRLRDIFYDKLEAFSKELITRGESILEEGLTIEGIEAEIVRLQGEIEERCAGDGFGRLTPDVQQGFFDIEEAITYTPDRKRLLKAMSLFLRLLSNG